MKKLTAFIVLALMYCPFVTQSQDETLYAKEITPAETPEAIKEALKKDFPDAIKDIHYYMVPENMLESEWGVAMKENMKTNNSNYYTVQLKGAGGGFVYGLYNADGELEVMKMEANDFELPEKMVAHATSGENEGYEIHSQKYKCYKVIDKRTNDEYVQLEVKKGDDIKTLYYSPAGDFIEEKK
jgi:hypothetical protein